jgi:hypothetical protein
LIKAFDLGLKSLEIVGIFQIFLQLAQLVLELLASFVQRALMFINAGALRFPLVHLFAQPVELLAQLVFLHRGLIVASQTLAALGLLRIMEDLFGRSLPRST